MAEQKTNPITREERIVVASSQRNDYGDLVVTDKNAKTYKVGKKRERLFDLFQPGNEVALAYSTYMNKEYIADALLVNKDTPKPQTVEKPPTVNLQNGSYALSYAKDLCIAGFIPKEDILSWAEVFKRYLNGDLGVDETKVIKTLCGEKK